MRTFGIIIVVILGLIGLTFVAGRGGHESYDAKTFKPGPVIGMVKGLSDDALEGRQTGTEGAERAREMIISRLQALELLKVGNSYAHPYELDLEGQTVEGVNLIGVIGGTAKSRDRIVITAHYDHLGTKDGEIYNGADDNASGVAGLLAIAEHFKRRKSPPKHTLMFVFFDSEDAMKAGSKAFMAEPPLPQKQLAFNLSLDQLARAEDGVFWTSGAALAPTLTPVMERVSKEAPLDLKQLAANGNDLANGLVEAGLPYIALRASGAETTPDATDTFDNLHQDTFLKSVETSVMVAQALDAKLEDLLGLPPLPSQEE